MSDKDHYWMQRALALARNAEIEGEVPVGAVIVLDNQVIGEGWNQPIASQDATAHAEIIALRQACQTMKNYRLPGADIYITLEPCIMCAGALIHARIARCIYATAEPKTGAAGSCIDAFALPNLNHRVECKTDILREESSQLIKQFFKARR
ncbi:tRNA adenosine(34) deaminase TadA [Methylophaga sulfidovorans]|uniref:tRNA-specific adenosine deaminase n=1 Tax=Methylophaga sulfidovorans TaxID=45496 RepID=A0A1I3U8U0_9GAMM|nr:tRNA adenosine(34) deaminase TadA [Methylophaga sulfidovorans]SFJ79342.1 tRNA(adenine34) deaminase [Methylophaga sulfidovorans]